MLPTVPPNIEHEIAAAELLPLLGRLLPIALQQQGSMLAVLDARSGRYALVDSAMAAFLGQPAERLLGSSAADWFEPAVLSALRAAEQTALAQPTPLRSEHRFDWGGQRREFGVWRVALPDASGATRWLCSVWQDLAPEQRREAQLRNALEQLEQQQRANEALRRELADPAMRDSASGLYARAHFEDQLRREVDLSTREHREFAIVYLELDPLSEEVLALGAAGQLLMFEAIGRLLRGGTRAMDASCRFDERRFAVLLSGVGLATAHSRMEGLRRKCATQIVVHGGQELGFTVSMGVASFPHTAQSQGALTAACEAALREAQRRGGNHVTLAAIRFDGAA
jgi:diguanylate cyclase (GGDEF)-like protein